MLFLCSGDYTADIQAAGIPCLLALLVVQLASRESDQFQARLSKRCITSAMDLPREPTSQPTGSSH